MNRGQTRGMAGFMVRKVTVSCIFACILGIFCLYLMLRMVSIEDEFGLALNRVEKLVQTQQSLVSQHNLERIATPAKTDVKARSTKITENNSNAVTKDVSDIHADPGCVAISCDTTKIAFYVKTGYASTDIPIMCVNNKKVFPPTALEKKAASSFRGISVACIDQNTLKVTQYGVFDTYINSDSLIDFLYKIPTNTIAIFATMDDAFTGLSSDAKLLLKYFGSSLIPNLKFRENWLMIGANGLSTDLSIENLKVKAIEDFGKSVDTKQCLDVRKLMSSNRTPLPDRGRIRFLGNLHSAQYVPNCDMSELCPFPSYAAYAGTSDGDSPSVCIDSNFIYHAEGTKASGDVVAMVVFDPINRSVVSKYSHVVSKQDNARMHVFLLSITPGHLLLGASNAGVAGALDQHTLSLFKRRFGIREFEKIIGNSTKDNPLSPDYSFSFIAQALPLNPAASEVESSTTLVQIFKSHHPEKRHATIKQCVPLDLRHSRMTVLQVNDESPVRQRVRNFCKQHDGHQEFCHPDAFIDTITPVPAPDSQTALKAFWEETPIAILAGLDGSELRQTLESFVRQAGANVASLRIYTSHLFTDIPKNIAAVFALPTNSVVVVEQGITYQEFLVHALKIHSQTALKDGRKQTVVVFPSAIASPDAMDFFHQTKSLLNGNAGIESICAWNPNGYHYTSAKQNAIHLADESYFPSCPMFLTSSQELSELMKRRECCADVPWYAPPGWFASKKDASATSTKASTRRVVFPDVSRCRGMSPSTMSAPHYAEHIKAYLYYRRRFGLCSGTTIDVDQIKSLQAFNDVKSWLEKNLKGAVKDNCDINERIPSGTKQHGSRYFEEDVWHPSSQSARLYLTYDDDESGGDLLACVGIHHRNVTLGSLNGIFSFHIERQFHRRSQQVFIFPKSLLPTGHDNL